MAEGQEIQRFEIEQDADEAAEVSEFGPWVRYSDHQAALERVEAERDRAVEYAKAHASAAENRRDSLIAANERAERAEARAQAAEQALEEVRAQLLIELVGCPDCGSPMEKQPIYNKGYEGWFCTNSNCIRYDTGGMSGRARADMIVSRVLAALAHGEQEATS